MRRTRHVVLPVRSWQYIGLLIVSLACLTLGLVSRDREGHAGSLAGPELEHQAPHEVDACPNVNPFTKMPPSHIIQPEETAKLANEQEAKIFGSGVSSASRKSVLSRSSSLDRVSRVDLQRIKERSARNRDLRAAERLSRSRTHVSENESVNRLRESRFRTIAQSRDARNLIDPATRLLRSQDLSARTTDRRTSEHRSLNFERHTTDHMNYRSEDRRTRSVEPREMSKIARRLNRDARSLDRQNSLNLQRRVGDRRSFSTERRTPDEINRQESREILSSRRDFRDLARRVDRRSEMRRHVSRRSVERRESSTIERRAIERADMDRSSRRENRRNLLDRSARIARQDTDRNDNRDRERFIQSRRAPLDRVANRERRSRSSDATRYSRKDLISFNNHRTPSRSTERLSINDLNREMFIRQIRSAEFNVERSNGRKSPSERRSVARHTERREVNRAERRRDEGRARDRRSLDRAMSRVSSEDLHREEIERSQRIVHQRNAAIRDNSRATSARETRYGLRETNIRERNKQFARSVRSFNRNSADRREFSRVANTRNRDRRMRDSSQLRDLTLERPERTNRSYRSREERRIVLQKSGDLRKDSERRATGRILERKMLREITLERTHGGDIMRRVATDSVRRFDSRGSSERKIDRNSSSGMADRHLERNSELRYSRGRVLGKRSAANLRDSSERGIEESSRRFERSRTQDRRLEQNLEMRNLISMRRMERRANSRASVLQGRVLRSSEGRSDLHGRRDLQVRNPKERVMARSIDKRLTEFPETESVRELRSSKLNVKDTSRIVPSYRAVRVARVPEQNREQRRLSAERMLSRAAENRDRLSAKWDRNQLDTRIDRNVEIRKIVPDSMKDNDFLKYSMTYDYIRQALVIGLCTVYGLSLYNKKSFIRNKIVQQVRRFTVW